MFEFNTLKLELKLDLNLNLSFNFIINSSVTLISSLDPYLKNHF